MKKEFKMWVCVNFKGNIWADSDGEVRLYKTRRDANARNVNIKKVRCTITY